MKPPYSSMQAATLWTYATIPYRVVYMVGVLACYFFMWVFGVELEGEE